MIECLRIRDFALVEALELELSPGFTVLTGETGAGKSILLQALGLLLGGRGSREWVRSGAAQARVEGLFTLAGPAREALGLLLDEAGVPWDPDEPLLVTRTVSADGRSRAHVNGAIVPLTLLGRIGVHLVEVSSQHQHQGLLREDIHGRLLDAGLPPEGREALDAYQEAHRAWARARAELERLERLELEGRERAEFLRFQAEEIRQAGLEPGEDERLRAERDLLRHAERLREAYGRAEAGLYSAEGSACERVGAAERELTAALAWDPALGETLDLVREAAVLLEEASARLRERLGRVEADPVRLEQVEDRLDLIRRLEKKHGAGADAILERLERLEQELEEIENVEWALEGARKDLARAERDLAGAAIRLRTARERAARDMERRVGAELAALAMGAAAFRVELEPVEPGPSGAERVRFLLAANPGEPPRPLARVASGGELSRILLALKNALRDDRVETLVFDEVDAGIGGATADAVAERLVRLAAGAQVICITHLPQIASRARHHLRVEKAVEGGRTVVGVRALAGAERVEELARMMGGRHVTETSRRHARELVERFSP